MSRYRLPIAIACLLLLATGTYLPALRGGFIWDDDDHLTQNPAVAAPDGLQRIWTSRDSSRYYPLTLTTFWVQRRLWDLHPFPYHATNVALHALSAVALYGVLRQLRLRGAWVAAAIWAVHPINVESVAWVTELKNTQSGLFFFLALACWLRCDAATEPRQQTQWYALSLLLFAAALLSKPSTVPLPAVLLLCVLWQRGRWQPADWRLVAPYLGLAAGMSLLTIAEQRYCVDQLTTPEFTLSLTDRLMVAGKALWFYAGTLLWPAPLMFVYPRWEPAAAGWLPVFGILLTGLGLWWNRSHDWARAAIFGVGAFAVLLLPVLGFVDVFYFRYSFVADHFCYLAAAPFVTGLTVLAAQRLSPVPARLLAGCAIAVCVLLSRQYMPAFHDNEALWTDVVTKNPRAAIAHNNLGNIRTGQHRWTEAEDHLQTALRLQPNYPEVHNNLGFLLAQQDRLPEAAASFRAAVRLKPDYADAWQNLGRVAALLGELPIAIHCYRQAVTLVPDAKAQFSLGLLLRKTGADAEAWTNLRAALALAEATGQSALAAEIRAAARR
jgi:tetratricopeptide (TPR) repeat protein